MTQHFLLTADARSMSPLAIARLSDDKCHALLCELRWGSTEKTYALNVMFSIKPITSPHADNGNASIAVTALVSPQALSLPIINCLYAPFCLPVRFTSMR